ncbi:MAG: glycosyltransferase family 4 protein [Verrucomicrobia bacterium]|nr:glycosyltransferase family 4 protein [Verrucomicrobiota bacterium]
MNAVLLAPEFTGPGGVQRILRLYLDALADDPTHGTLTLETLNDSPAHLASRPAATAGMVKGKPLKARAHARSKTRFTRGAWSACSRADRIVCGHIGQLPIAAFASRRATRLALVAHGIEVWQPANLLRRLALRRCDRIFCVSNYTRNRLAANHPELKTRLRIVPNALDPALLDRPKPSPPPLDHPPTVLCVGRLCAADAYKGYDLLLRAFALLPHAAFYHRPALLPRLRFVGEGDDLARLQQLAINLHVADRVEFSGRLSDPDLSRAFADCTCFALPSSGEGFGLVYLEALAAGRPCVGVRAGAVPELITPAAGTLAAPDDPAALAAALTDCLIRCWDPGDLRKLAQPYSYDHLVTTLATSWY